MIRKVVEDHTDDEIDLQFETASDLVYGIELIANGYRHGLDGGRLPAIPGRGPAPGTRGEGGSPGGG
jgi:hypothetical protein